MRKHSRGVAHWIGVDVPEPTSVRPSFVRCDVCGELTASRAVGARGYARHRKCVKHGERATYDRGCRCQECRDAKTALMREYVRMVKERDGRSPTQKYRPARGRVCDWCGRALTSAAGTAADGLMLCKPHRTEKRDRDARGASRRRAFQAKIDKAAIKTPAIFKLIAAVGEIPERDMFNTFNMGVGMCLVLGKEDADKAVETLEYAGQHAFVMGDVRRGEKSVHL